MRNDLCGHGGKPGFGPRLAQLALALVVQSLAFTVIVLGLADGSVSTPAWLALHAVCAITLGLCLLWRGARLQRRVWLSLALYALFFALFFSGANFGLDALHGAHRRKAEVAQQLGGLELWWVLCPGVFSMALGALAGGWLDRLRAARTSAPPPSTTTRRQAP